MKGIIAIDGGGSKSEVVFVSETSDILLRFIIGCCNPNDIGMNTSIATLLEGINQCFMFAKENDIEVCSIFLGVAGIEFGESKKILKDKLVELLNYKNIYVEGDLASSVELTLSDKDGIVIISGTGFNMAIKDNNSLLNIGGWGYLADDYLSGFDLGKDALIYASRYKNKVGEETILLTLLEEELKHDLWYSMEEIYKQGIKKVASFSNIVVKAYKENDNVAKKIIVSRIEKLANVILDKTKELKNKEIYLLGGIFQNNKFIVDLLQEKLKKYKIIVVNEKTILGATKLAFKFANIDFVEDKFIEKYKEIVS